LSFKCRQSAQATQTIKSRRKGDSVLKGDVRSFPFSVVRSARRPPKRGGFRPRAKNGVIDEAAPGGFSEGARKAKRLARDRLLQKNVGGRNRPPQKRSMSFGRNRLEMTSSVIGGGRGKGGDDSLRAKPKKQGEKKLDGTGEPGGTRQSRKKSRGIGISDQR